MHKGLLLVLQAVRLRLRLRLRLSSWCTRGCSSCCRQTRTPTARCSVPSSTAPPPSSPAGQKLSRPPRLRWRPLRSGPPWPAWPRPGTGLGLEVMVRGYGLRLWLGLWLELHAPRSRASVAQIVAAAQGAKAQGAKAQGAAAQGALRRVAAAARGAGRTPTSLRANLARVARAQHACAPRGPTRRRPSPSTYPAGPPAPCRSAAACRYRAASPRTARATAARGDVAPSSSLAWTDELPLKIVTI